MNYLGGFLMIGAAAAFGVCLLGLALALLDPVTGGTGAVLALVVGAAGAEMVSRWEVA